MPTWFPPEARRYLTGGLSNIYAIRARAKLLEGAVQILEAVIELTPRQPAALAHPRMAAGDCGLKSAEALSGILRRSDRRRQFILRCLPHPRRREPLLS